MVYVARRALAALVALFVVSVMTFTIFHLVPGDPAAIMLGTEADESAIKELRHQMGIDQPLLKQYVKWVSQALHGELGESFRLSQPVSKLVIQRIGVTSGLAFLAMSITVLVSVPLGVWAAIKKGSLVEAVISTLSQIGLTIPYFWLGIMFILFFALRLGWFPPGGYVPWGDSPKACLASLFLPALALAVQRIAIFTGMVKASVADEIISDYVRTAKGKGVHPLSIAFRHILRNAMVPLATVFGIQLAGLLAGSVVAEQVFALPGVGQLLVMGVSARDLPLVQGVVLVMATGVVTINLVVDLAYGVLDPRLRYN